MSGSKRSSGHRVAVIGGGFGGLGFANRVVVLTRWGWTFFTHGRGSRLITGQPLLPDIEEPEPPA